MKTQIKLISSLLSLFFLALSVSPAYAVVETVNLRNTQIDDTIVPNVSITVTPTPTKNLIVKPSAKLDFKLPLKKTNVLNEIERRITSLNKLIEKMGEINRLTSIQTNTLQAQVRTEIAKLEELKLKINSETDADALKLQKQSVFNSYKYYALYVPEIQIIAHANKIIDIANAMNAKTTDAGLKKIISDSSAKAQSAIDMVIVLTPEGTNNKATLTTARDMLKEARTSLNTVYSSLKSL